MPHEGQVICERDGMVCVDCKICGFIHVQNPPSEEDIRNFYAKQFFQTAKPNYLEEEKEDAAWHQMQYEDRWDNAERLAAAAGRKIKTVLELGCGTGRFLEFLSQRPGVTRVLGVEPNQETAEAARRRGLDVLTGSWDEIGLEKLGRFDFVAAQFVLEHLRNPIDFLKIIADKLIEKNGVLYLGVPNDFSAVQPGASRAAGKPFYWVDGRHHLNYFNFETLERLLKRFGFRPELRDATFPMEGYLLGGFNYIQDGPLGRRLHRQRAEYELAMDRVSRSARRSMQRAMAEQGLGRDALVYAIKT